MKRRNFLPAVSALLLALGFFFWGARRACRRSVFAFRRERETSRSRSILSFSNNQREKPLTAPRYLLLVAMLMPRQKISQPARNGGELFVARRLAVIRDDQLQVIDDHQANAMPLLHTPCVGGNADHVLARLVVEKDGCF
jgi:hypothetical protein